MIAAFLHVGQDISLPMLMVASVRRWMPRVHILHMTDAATPAINGADQRQELDYDGERLMTYRLRHLAKLEGEVLSLDTDIIVQADLSSVFGKPFDVALTRRRGQLLYGGKDIVKDMPFNSGVVFSRSRQFWQDCLAMCEHAPEDIQRWFGDQLCIAAVANSGRYGVMELPCDKFNYTPKTEAEDVSSRYVIHFKGNKKSMMPIFAKRLGYAGN